MISQKDYCSKICGGKCCCVWEKQQITGPKLLTQCPKLAPNKLCSIYKERFEQDLPYSFSDIVKDSNNDLQLIRVDCGRIEQMIKDGVLPKWIEDQCCFAHPELLEDF